MGGQSPSPVADPARLVAALLERGETLALCESLTAGLAAATVAGVPGSSAVLRGGLVTYATELKASLAGVPQEVLDRVGPVSAECAAAMAVGVKDRCGSDWGVSLTGVAGPGQQDGHPVGEVWIGLADPSGAVAAVRAGAQDPGVATGQADGRGDAQPLLSGSRNSIREQAVAWALGLVIDAAKQLPSAVSPGR